MKSSANSDSSRQELARLPRRQEVLSGTNSSLSGPCALVGRDQLGHHRRVDSSTERSTSQTPRDDAPPEQRRTEHRLRDGTSIAVRAIDIGDRDALDAFHERCSDRTHYLRFFSSQRHLQPKMLERFVSVDHDRRDALVAERDGAIIGVARYDLRTDGRRAEVAFVVEDRYQGKGIATILLHALAVLASSRGIAGFTAITLAENIEMQQVFRHSGYVVSAKRQPRDPSVIEFSFPIETGS